MLSLAQYMSSKGHTGTSSFLTTLEEQSVSFINDESVLEFLDNNPHVSTNDIKNNVYKKHFRVRNRKKQTGFENFVELDTLHRNKLKDKFKNDKMSQLEFEIGSLDTPPRDKFKDINFVQACVMAAEHHKREADLLDKKIYVCMSGGLDSEITAMSFKLAGIDFVPFIVDYNGKNSHDTSYATVWCLENNVKPIIHVLDIEKFWNLEMYEYANYSKVTSPQILTYHKIIDLVCEQYNGYVVMGGEIRVYAKRNKKVVASYAWEKNENHFGELCFNIAWFPPEASVIEK